MRELVVGTKVAPPFAMKAEDGSWHGISIELWRRIANQTHLRYRFQETTLKDLTEGVADGSLDAGVAALTVTGPRRQMVDFTQPFYSTGLGIAVARENRYHVVADCGQRVLPRFSPRNRCVVDDLACRRRCALARRAAVQ